MPKQQQIPFPVTSLSASGNAEARALLLEDNKVFSKVNEALEEEGMDIQAEEEELEAEDEEGPEEDDDEHMVAAALFDLSNMAGVAPGDEDDEEQGEGEEDEEALHRQPRRPQPARRRGGRGGGGGRGGRGAQRGRRKRGAERSDEDPDYDYDALDPDEDLPMGRVRKGAAGNRIGTGGGRWPVAQQGAAGGGPFVDYFKAGGPPQQWQRRQQGPQGRNRGSRGALDDDDAASGLSPAEGGSGREISPFPMAGMTPGMRPGWGPLGFEPGMGLEGGRSSMPPPWMTPGGLPPHLAALAGSGGMMPHMISPAMMARLMAGQQHQAQLDPAAMMMQSSAAVASTRWSDGGGGGLQHRRRCATHVSIAHFIMDQRRVQNATAARRSVVAGAVGSEAAAGAAEGSAAGNYGGGDDGSNDPAEKPEPVEQSSSEVGAGGTKPSAIAAGVVSSGMAGTAVDGDRREHSPSPAAEAPSQLDGQSVEQNAVVAEAIVTQRQPKGDLHDVGGDMADVKGSSTERTPPPTVPRTDQKQGRQSLGGGPMAPHGHFPFGLPPYGMMTANRPPGSGGNMLPFGLTPPPGANFSPFPPFPQGVPYPPALAAAMSAAAAAGGASGGGPLGVVGSPPFLPPFPFPGMGPPPDAEQLARMQVLLSGDGGRNGSFASSLLAALGQQEAIRKAQPEQRRHK